MIDMRPGLFIILCLLLTLTVAHAQQNTEIKVGSVKGFLKDTVGSHIIRSATVSVYKAADNSLISYQLSNSFGYFLIKNLPVSTPLNIKISHVEYGDYSANIMISEKSKELDLKSVILNPRQITLKEVSITVPPIRMNGDTLEFNAASYGLDSNAVVEDLLRKIPNITLWGDGMITVNGKEVKNLLVNGKAFFGGNRKIILQNISNKALQTIQVYNTAKQKYNPLDSTIEMNLKLKKGKDIGFFGKIHAGYGTTDRYESDLSLNVFSPKMQVSIVAGSNNINKIPQSISSLTENSTFKGVDAQTDYQPNFRMAGISKTKSLGTTFDYNFISKPTDENKNTISANYFVQEINLDKISNTDVTTFLSNNENLINNNSYLSKEISKKQNQSTRYELIKNGHYLTINQSFSNNSGKDQQKNLSDAKNNNGLLTSSNDANSINDYDKNSFNFQADYQYNPNLIVDQKITSFNANYQLDINNQDLSQLNRTSFTSYVDPASNKNFDRKYDIRNNNVINKLFISMPKLKELFLDEEKLLGINFGFLNDLSINSYEEFDEIKDKDANDNYTINEHLTNLSKIDVIKDNPSIEINKRFVKRLTNRYRKILSINFNLAGDLVSYHATSDAFIRNIKRNYSNFTPGANVRYSNYHVGKFEKIFKIAYKTVVNIPTLEQLAPLTDSINVYYLRYGNLNLKESINRNLTISFTNEDYSSQNTFNYNLDATAVLIDNSIIDSVYVNEKNQQSIFQTNAGGYRYLTLNAEARKSKKIRNASFQIGIKSNIGFYKRPGFLNNTFFFSTIFKTYNSMNFNYRYTSVLSIDFDQSFSTFTNKQRVLESQNSGSTLESKFSASCNFNKKINFSSSINIVNNYFSNSADVNFIIWNASVVYRLLKGNNLELKLSALDLLKQNKSIINFSDNNSLTRGSQNVLKQYIMFNLAYYPRKFGKKR